VPANIGQGAIDQSGVEMDGQPFSRRPGDTCDSQLQ
jgi:hypothetical protein